MTDDPENYERWGPVRVDDPFGPSPFPAFESVVDLTAVDERRRGDLRVVLDPTTLTLLQQILATDWRVLSVPELAARNADLTSDAIRKRLDALTNRERPFVREHIVDAPAGMPDRFYSVTAYAEEFLRQTGFFEPIPILYQAYQAARTPKEIRHIEAFDGRPRVDD